jgi:hypothetical protein
MNDLRALRPESNNLSKGEFTTQFAKQEKSIPQKLIQVSVLAFEILRCKADPGQHIDFALLACHLELTS